MATEEIEPLVLDAPSIRESSIEKIPPEMLEKPPKIQ